MTVFCMITAVAKKNLHRSLTILISLIWLINGLYCKLLNQIPRHRMIVARILGEEHAEVLTNLIGSAEVLMAIWVLSRFKSRINAILQIIIIATMNIIEFFLAKDLLLFGPWNAVWAAALSTMIYLNEFQFNRSRNLQPK
ncbi:DoxX-like family protein [Terrimonas sp. NA20]|uniref:DoxX-like family protein n=1 Tax=Terrimonas ginsenosidimutans TaxID=2908004 RepID=A0ABS9KKK4_9BACT|nr:DoxX-like family protein [Terrimonas ginsenosidimutans]MCG2612846.1 DoxX-like family protein [Terrimonas ginsenosidimutans]